MTYYPGTTLLPPSPSPGSYADIYEIIFALWQQYLEVESNTSVSQVIAEQHLEITSAIIDYWENILSEIHQYEMGKG